MTASSPAAPPGLALAPSLDVAALSRRFKQVGRLQITDFLSAASAEALHQHLLTSAKWRHIVNSGPKIFEASSGDFDAMPSQQRRALESAMFAAAATGFQYSYDTLRVADSAAERDRSSLLDAFADFMNAPDTLDLLRRISGSPHIAFADAQATRYRSGDFLTRHDDAVSGKNRVLAYVLNLSREWRAEWGGLLLFNGKDNDVVEAMTPRYNTLSLFAVPQPHSVSYVAPYAARPRLSVTGWLRTGVPSATS